MNHLKGQEMKYSLLFVALLSASTLVAVETDETINNSESIEVVEFKEVQPVDNVDECTRGDCGEVNTINDELLALATNIRVSVVGQGVAPMHTSSPAQAYALAKRAAIADGYRMIAERVKGVRVEGQDLIKNMMVARSSVRTSVNAMIRDASVLETTFKDGLCEVEMEIVLSHSLFAR